MKRFLTVVFVLCLMSTVAFNASAQTPNVQVYFDAAGSLALKATVLVGNGSRLYVNPDGTCPCGEVLGTAETNWGKIKALYE